MVVFTPLNKECSEDIQFVFFKRERFYYKLDGFFENVDQHLNGIGS